MNPIVLTVIKGAAIFGGIGFVIGYFLHWLIAKAIQRAVAHAIENVEIQIDPGQVQDAIAEEVARQLNTINQPAGSITIRTDDVAYAATSVAQVDQDASVWS